MSADTQFTVRQGDVLLRRIDRIPDGLQEVPRENGRLVLAHGEVTGHAHVIEGDATFLAADVAELERAFVRIEEESELVHDEHSTITLPPGDYEVRRQREYAPEAPQWVAD